MKYLKLSAFSFINNHAGFPRQIKLLKFLWYWPSGIGAIRIYVLHKITLSYEHQGSTCTTEMFETRQVYIKQNAITSCNGFIKGWALEKIGWLWGWLCLPGFIDNLEERFSYTVYRSSLQNVFLVCDKQLPCLWTWNKTPAINKVF